MDAVLLRDNTKTEDYYSAGAVTAGDVVNIDGRSGVAIGNIAAGGTGAVYTNGIFLIAAVELAMSRGMVVGFDNDGTPYGGSTTGAVTPKLAVADIALLGTVIVDKVAAFATALVDLNAIPNDLIGILAGRKFEAVSANKTLDIQDVGKVLLVDTDAFAFTLPAIAVEFEFVIMNVMADAACLVTVSPNTNDKIMGADLAGANNKDRLLTKTTSKSNDFIHLVYGSADGYNVVSERGVWAAEG